MIFTWSAAMADVNLRHLETSLSTCCEQAHPHGPKNQKADDLSELSLGHAGVLRQEESSSNRSVTNQNQATVAKEVLFHGHKKRQRTAF